MSPFFSSMNIITSTESLILHQSSICQNLIQKLYTFRNIIISQMMCVLIYYVRRKFSSGIFTVIYKFMLPKIHCTGFNIFCKLISVRFSVHLIDCSYIGCVFLTLTFIPFSIINYNSSSMSSLWTSLCALYFEWKFWAKKIFEIDSCIIFWK